MFLIESLVLSSSKVPLMSSVRFLKAGKDGKHAEQEESRSRIENQWVKLVRRGNLIWINWERLIRRCSLI